MLALNNKGFTPTLQRLVQSPPATRGHLMTYGCKFSSSVTLAAFQVLNKHMWLVATVWDSIDPEHSVITDRSVGVLLVPSGLWVGEGGPGDVGELKGA